MEELFKKAYGLVVKMNDGSLSAEEYVKFRIEYEQVEEDVRRVIAGIIGVEPDTITDVAVAFVLHGRTEERETEEGKELIKVPYTDDEIRGAYKLFKSDFARPSTKDRFVEFFHRAYEIADMMADESLPSGQYEQLERDFKQLREVVRKEIARVVGVSPEVVRDSTIDYVLEGRTCERKTGRGLEMFRVPLTEKEVVASFYIINKDYSDYLNPSETKTDIFEELFNRAQELSAKMLDESLPDDEYAKVKKEYEQLEEETKKEIARAAGVAPEVVRDSAVDYVLEGNTVERMNGSEMEVIRIPLSEEEVRDSFNVINADYSRFFKRKITKKDKFEELFDRANELVDAMSDESFLTDKFEEIVRKYDQLKRDARKEIARVVGVPIEEVRDSAVEHVLQGHSYTSSSGKGLVTVKEPYTEDDIRYIFDSINTYYPREFELRKIRNIMYERLFNSAQRLYDEMLDESLPKEKAEELAQEYEQLRERARQEIAKSVSVNPADVKDSAVDHILHGHSYASTSDSRLETVTEPYTEDEIICIFDKINTEDSVAKKRFDTVSRPA